MDYQQLPRNDLGFVTGTWRLRHRLPEYNDAFGGVSFKNGVTTAPLDGPTTARLLVVLGDVVDAEPWDTAPAAPPAARPATTAETTPTTWADLQALSEEQLLGVAEELTLRVDKRWKAPRLRTVLAEELGIESGENAHA